MLTVLDEKRLCGTFCSSWWYRKVVFQISVIFWGLGSLWCSYAPDPQSLGYARLLHPARSRLYPRIALLLANIEGNDRLIIGEQSGQTCQPGNDQWHITLIALAQEFCHKQKSKAAPKRADLSALTSCDSDYTRSHPPPSSYILSGKQMEEAMGMLIIRHKVKDYDQWRPMFDKHS